MGEDDTGFFLLVWEKGGGFYIGVHYFSYTQLIDIKPRIDVGASQLIADGKIKLKNDSLIERFTKTSIKFQNGSELPADVVVFATG
jgi:hypothetical protein